MSKLRRTIRKTHQSGAWVYATLEAIANGYAAARLATNGARVSNIPVTSPELQVGDLVILDYSSGIPPVIIPAAGRETIIATALQTVKASASEPTIPLITSTDIGVKLKGCSNVGAGESWETIRFTDVVWDTAMFFDPLYPSRITFKVAGIYLMNAHIGIQYPGVIPSLFYQIRFFSTTSDYSLPIASDFPVLGQDEDIPGFSGTGGPYVGTNQPKYINVKGLGAFKVNDWAELQVRTIGASSCSFIISDISPVAEVQMLGQIGDVL